MLQYVTGTLDDYILGKGDLYFADARFGDIYLPFEEAFFMCAVVEAERFYAELKPCAAAFFTDAELFEDLYRYQISNVTLPGALPHDETFLYRWAAYFSTPFAPFPRLPERRKNTVRFIPERYDDLSDFCREVVWYGKSKNRTTVQNKSEV